MTIDPQATARMETLVVADRYRLLDVIASGGVATVFRATDELLEREVAVKLLKDATDGSEDRARFVVESQTLARLTHPGLVTMLDAGTAGDQPFLVMELVDGPSLSATLAAPLDLARAAEIGAQIATALDYAHSQGVVHRDVKPGNVLMRSDGRVKLADFGIARLVGQRSEYTRTGIVVGSVHYLAPEQVAFEEITPAVDVYALGMLLLRAVTGQHAFDGSTIETALARLSAAPAIPEELPAGWRSLLTSMTARQPAARPTAAEVADRLTRLTRVGDAGTTKVIPHLAAPAVHVVPLARRRRLTPVALAAAALALMLYVAATVAGGPGDGVVPVAGASESEAATGVQKVHPAGAAIQPVADVQVSTPTPVRHHSKGAGHHQPKAGHGKKPKGKKPKGRPAKGKGKH